MNTNKIKSLWNFLVRNRAKFAVGVTAAAFLLLMYRNARQLEEFMKENNLLEVYNQWLIEE